MDVSRLGSGQASVKTMPGAQIIDLDSDSETEVADALETARRVGIPISSGVNDFEALVGNVEQSPDEDEDGESADWSEVESLFEDTLEEMGDESLYNAGPESCTLEEANAFRQQLRTIGPENLAISRELSKRIKLPQYNTIDDAVELIKRSKNIIVLTGAGISTSLGIPDFRSKDIGLYSKLAHLGLNDPQEVFDISIFREDPSIFYQVARDILPSTDRFTPTHAFIALLQSKGKLLTNYSQNIDNIEAAAGILPEKLIQCHGSFATASCVECKYQVPGEHIFGDIKAGRIPKCDRCLEQMRRLKAPAAMKRKRSYNSQDKKKKKSGFDALDGDTSSEDEYDDPKAGVMKPDITFFGEPLPDRFSDRLTNHDKDLVDLVIVIGTSLKVAPVSEVVPYLPTHIPQMYISRTPVSHVNFDVDMLGDCDIVVAELCRRAGWDLKHDMIPEGQVVDVKLQDGFQSRHIFSERKPA
ncbi:related to sirtuin 5 and related class III sirtuins (SIR2 family) [Phialocephala subalpina]|uniref:Related to sirtuin 5 and related class III sirtuins (SIR2 family) n=1 Tax=Phialocephala subalpina TaxID=576137 RepID=A0A1L7X7J1_9HELO|nr:related to sirtuin 5 and related class III sirtuins (SIR2 family) [Phialocephala subalpina]